MEKKIILFDCMETLVDLTKLPNLRDYAAWGYEGSGVEELWKDFDEFFQYYVLARADILARLQEHQDYEMLERFQRTVQLSLPDMGAVRALEAAESLYRNYWKNYKAMCYINADVLETLPRLGQKYRLGVVSNFMVMNGIEELLESNGIISHFESVVTSISLGWSKPHPIIYKKALDNFAVQSDEAIFVGDDFINDYITPEKLGMKPVFLDRYGRHPEITSRITDFYQLTGILL
jgi:putative hydrolase of the HAD superfamily